jgi:hypothetical protein
MRQSTLVNDKYDGLVAKDEYEGKLGKRAPPKLGLVEFFH